MATSLEMGIHSTIFYWGNKSSCSCFSERLNQPLQHVPLQDKIFPLTFVNYIEDYRRKQLASGSLFVPLLVVEIDDDSRQFIDCSDKHSGFFSAVDHCYRYDNIYKMLIRNGCAKDEYGQENYLSPLAVDLLRLAKRYTGFLTLEHSINQRFTLLLDALEKL